MGEVLVLWRRVREVELQGLFFGGITAERLQRESGQKSDEAVPALTGKGPANSALDLPQVHRGHA